jgi:phosphoribosylformimino-5-aminoimidazole carboxamide ribotide isomerase
VQVIPVLDVKKGKAVQAVAGRRERYRPLRSWLCSDSDPLQAALNFKNVFGFRELYIADLEAIAGKKPDLPLIGELARCTGLKLLVDVGVRKVADALAAVNSGASEAVIGTETLPEIKLVENCVNRLGAEKVTVSLDIVGGKILSPSPSIRSSSPSNLAEALEALGVPRIILLDLSKVGTGKGVNLELLRGVLARVSVKILVGGGVRNISDLKLLRGLGVEGVLVASAFHSHELTREVLEAEGLLP